MRSGWVGGGSQMKGGVQENGGGGSGPPDPPPLDTPMLPINDKCIFTNFSEAALHGFMTLNNVYMFTV